VYQKLKRLGLGLVEEDVLAVTSSSIKIPRELPSIEEALKVLVGASRAAAAHGLDRVEVQGLQAVATLAQTQKEIFRLCGLPRP
jgi:hypothetical protein